MGETVLVVDDEREIADLIEVYLKNEGFAVRTFYRAKDALACIAGEKIDLAVLDVMLPDGDGFALCRQIREEHTFLILLLTAKGEETDKITGFALGADDYVTKPFSVSELMARVDAIYRRVAMSGGGQTSTLHYGPFEMNLKSRVLRKNGDPVELTQVEYQIMELFLKNPDTVLDRMEILKSIWGENYYGDDKIIDVNIRRLRMKIEEEPSRPRHITTVWGVGYRFKA